MMIFGIIDGIADLLSRLALPVDVPIRCGLYPAFKSVLALLYECHKAKDPYDNEHIKADFEELYRQMNGMPLREMDKIIYPVCKLCRDHERAGFVEGILRR